MDMEQEKRNQVQVDLLRQINEGVRQMYLFVEEQGPIGLDDGFPALCAALAAAQSEIKQPPLDASVTVYPRQGNPYTFRYSTLGACLQSVQGPLGKHGLFMRHQIKTTSEKVTVWIEVFHRDGGVLAGEQVSAMASNGGPQAIGSIITYLRRYTLHAFFGLTGMEDDDGNAAEGNGIQSKSDPAKQPGRQPAKPPAKKREPKTDAEKALRARFDHARGELVKQMGEEEADHQIAGIKGQYGKDYPAIADAVEDMAKQFAGFVPLADMQDGA